MNKAKNNLGYFYQTKEKGHKVNGASKVKSGMKIELYLFFFELMYSSRLEGLSSRLDRGMFQLFRTEDHSSQLEA